MWVSIFVMLKVEVETIKSTLCLSNISGTSLMGTRATILILNRDFNLAESRLAVENPVPDTISILNSFWISREAAKYNVI